jgi:hypothetical protein
MKSKLNLLWTVLFWGSIWGIAEASMGWVLHAAQIHHGTSNILFAFGIACMFAAATRSGKGAMAVMLTAVVASAIKFVDFFLPGSPQSVLHPALYILLEGAMTAIISQIFSIQPRQETHPTLSLLEARLAFPALAVALVLTLAVG